MQKQSSMTFRHCKGRFYAFCTFCGGREGMASIRQYVASGLRARPVDVGANFFLGERQRADYAARRFLVAADPKVSAY
jgi:hypothetical protein